MDDYNLHDLKKSINCIFGHLVTLLITPPIAVTLREIMGRIENKVIKAMRGHEMVKGIEVGISGIADKLNGAPKVLFESVGTASVSIF